MQIVRRIEEMMRSRRQITLLNSRDMFNIIEGILFLHRSEFYCESVQHEQITTCATSNCLPGGLYHFVILVCQICQGGASINMLNEYFKTMSLHS